MTTIGWRLDPQDRAKLLERFPAEWPDVVADHITFEAQVGQPTAMPSVDRAEIVGGINDGEGLQAMVVAINGETERPDGGTYHIPLIGRLGAELERRVATPPMPDRP